RGRGVSSACPGAPGRLAGERAAGGRERGRVLPPAGIDRRAPREADAGQVPAIPGEDELAHRGGNDGEHGVGHAPSTSRGPPFVRLVRASTPGHTWARWRASS